MFRTEYAEGRLHLGYWKKWEIDSTLKEQGHISWNKDSLIVAANILHINDNVENHLRSTPYISN